MVKLCLTIGVGRARPLSSLPGAITAAREMKQWAEQAGFQTVMLTDEGFASVTVSSIRDALLGLLPENDVVEAFVLHFAGHGYRAGAEQNMWLPTDWYSELRAISVEGLKRRLYVHGIKNLTIVSDACRSIPATIDIADLIQDSILPRGPHEPMIPTIDRFNAVGDGNNAYMLNGDDRAPPRCIFSTVLIEGLCGHRIEAFDRYLPGCVTPESLDLYSKARMREIGEIYRVNCTPENTVGTPRDHIVYFRRDELGSPETPAPCWPTPPDAISQEYYQSNISGIEIGRPPIAPAGSPTKKSSRFKSAYIRKRFSVEKNYKEYDGNLVVLGQEPKRIWTTTGYVHKKSQDYTNEYDISVQFGGSAQILVEFRDGVFASAVVYHGLLTVLSYDKRGLVGWACASQLVDTQPQINNSLEAIARLREGSLSADQVDLMAINLREAKHLNPILGAISSYLYDYSGDIDSIRRMAYFYWDHGQSIPFDVAFMGLLPMDWGGSTYTAVVPSVVEREPSPENEKLPNWVTRATDNVSYLVAGLWPWLRQGWEYVEEPDEQEAITAEGLQGAIPYLLPSQFTSFSRPGAEILIRRFHMRGK